MSSVSEKFSYIKEHYKSRGLNHVMKIVWRRVFSPEKSCRILVALSKPRPVEKAIEASKDHVFKFATADELRALQSDPGHVITDEYVEFVERGSAKCLLQMDGEKLTGYAWIWTHKLAYIDDGFHLNLPDDTIYNFKAYTAPEYRGYGYQALRHLKLLEMLKDEGVKRLFGFVEYRNLNSLKGVQKSGYEQVGMLTIEPNKKKRKVVMKVELEDTFWSKQART